MVTTKMLVHYSQQLVFTADLLTLDACGNVNAAVDNGGINGGLSYDFGNGLTAAVGYAGEDNLANEEGRDAYGLNVAYTGDSYGVSFTYGAWR